MSNWDKLIHTALASRLDGETLYRFKTVVAGWRPLPPVAAPEVWPTPEEDAALRDAGRAEDPMQALHGLLKQVNDSDAAMRLARGIRDRWYVYGAFPQVAGKMYVHTVEDALLRAWNLNRPHSSIEARAELREILVNGLMEPTMKHTPPQLGGRRKPGRRP